jgi:translation initiation factor 2-alpha kinase 3
MSKFFRSSNSISSSDSSSTSSADNDETEHVAPTTEESSLVAGHELESEQQDVAVLNRPSPPGTNQHREFLLHALLEERCMNEVLSERERATRLSSQENVQAEANRRYQRLCDRLASYNLISAGLEHENHAKTRQRYRDGLNVISRQPDGGSGRSTVPYTLRRLLTGPENVQYSTGQLEFAPTIGNRQILESRYRQE